MWGLIAAVGAYALYLRLVHSEDDSYGFLADKEEKNG